LALESTAPVMSMLMLKIDLKHLDLKHMLAPKSIMHDDTKDEQPSLLDEIVQNKVFEHNESGSETQGMQISVENAKPRFEYIRAI
jgi:hypothetical protein